LSAIIKDRGGKKGQTSSGCSWKLRSYHFVGVDGIWLGGGGDKDGLLLQSIGEARACSWEWGSGYSNVCKQVVQIFLPSTYNKKIVIIF